MDNLPINEILVENRRREDFGDVEGLAESIRRFGLFHPIVVDDQNRLVAGERRLRACKLLGWLEIPVKTYKDLTDEERNEIELEENNRRKDLTSYEQSKKIVRQVEVAKAIEESKPEIVLIHDESKLNGDLIAYDGQKTIDIVLSHDGTKVGRPTENGNLRDIAEKIGIPRSTIHRAQTHVEAVRKYPELKHIAPMQKDAITIAKNLDALPESEREESRRKLMEYDSDTTTLLAEKPPLPKREHAPGGSPGEKWVDTLYKNQKFLTGIEHNGGIQYLWRNWTVQNRQSFYQSVCRMEQSFSNLREAMEELFNYEETEQDARQDVA